MKGGSWILFGAICASGLGIGLVIRSFLYGQAQITLDPAIVEFDDGHIQGEPLEAHFDLRNESRGTASVNSILTSCGCMAILGSDGPLKPPFIIESGGVVPIGLSISTAPRFGPQVFALTVLGVDGLGRELESRAELRVNLLGTLRADPASLIVRDLRPDEEYCTEFVLADMLPDPGVRIREIISSHPERISAEFEPSSGVSHTFGDWTTAKVRGKIRMTCKCDARPGGRISEIITVLPEDTRFPVVQIPVYCEMADPPLRLLPAGLTFSPAAGKFRRSVVLESDAPMANVSIVEQPTEIKVRIEGAAERERTLIVEGDTAQLPTDHASDVLVAVDGHELRLPIRLLPD